MKRFKCHHYLRSKTSELLINLENFQVVIENNFLNQILNVVVFLTLDS